MTSDAGTSPTTTDRLLALAGIAFLALLLAGNSLALSGVEQVVDPTDAQLQAALAQQATGGLNQLGLVLELLAFGAFAVLVGRLALRLRPSGWSPVLVIAGAVAPGERC